MYSKADVSPTGTQKVFYPSTWQGTVEASSASGGVDIQWQGFRIVEHQKGNGVRERIKGIRIAQGGYLGIVGDSGSVVVRGNGTQGSSGT